MRFVCGIFLYLFIGCGSEKTGENANVFCYNESNGITTLDPAFARDLEIMWVTNQLFDGLVEMDSALNIVPCIAKRWEISGDGLQYSFYLDQNVRFHSSPFFADTSGRLITAHDFVYSFNRIIDPAVASPGQWIFEKINKESGKGFFAVDDTTLIITLKQPFQPFLGMLTMQYCNVVPREVVEHYGADFRAHPVGSGPFRFAFWYEGTALVFHRNPEYFQKDKNNKSLPYLDAIKIEFVKDMAVEFQGLLQGRYDFMSGIHSSFKDELLDPSGNLVPAYENEIVFQKVPFIKTDYLGIVVDPSAEISKDSPLLDRRVRTALNVAIDRNQMVEHLRNNSVFAADKGFVPVSLKKSNDQYFAYDPERASLLLDSAGFTDRKKLPEIVVAGTSDYTDLLEFIQHQWGLLGIRTKIQVMQGSTFREATANYQIPVFRKSWLADYPDPENFLSVFYSGNFCPAGPNYTHFSNPQFDQWYMELCAEKDADRKNELVQSMDSLIMFEAPVIPLYYDQVSHFIRTNVTGLVTNPVNMLDLKTVKKFQADLNAKSE